MDRSLAFYRDILGMTVLGDRMTDPTEGGRLHNYRRQRQARRWVSLAYGNGATPTLTLTSHPGDDPDGQPIKLDMVGISHISFGVADVKALTGELLKKGVELAPLSPLPAPMETSAASTCTTPTASWSSSIRRSSRYVVFRQLSRVNYICRLASISFAGSPPRRGPVAGLRWCGSWGRQTPG